MVVKRNCLAPPSRASPQSLGIRTTCGVFGVRSRGRARDIVVERDDFFSNVEVSTG